MDNSSESATGSTDLKLREVIALLWSRWLFIGSVTSAFALFSVYYALNNTTSIFESQAVFSVPDDSQPSLANVALSRFVPDFAQPSSNNLHDKVSGRDFVLEVVNELALEKDPFFNGSLRPLKGLARLQQQFFSNDGSTVPPSQFEILDGVVNVFRANVSVSDTLHGASVITVAHENPKTASKIANEIVVRILEDNRNKQIESNQERVEYLRNELRFAREELYEAVSSIQEFAVSNGVLSDQALLQQSQRLLPLRERRSFLKRAKAGLELLATSSDGSFVSEQAIIDALELAPELISFEISSMLGLDGLELKGFPLTHEQAEDALEQLANQISSVEKSIFSLEQTARASATASAEKARLEQEAEIAQATYEVLVEQFKQQDLASGFELESGEIFQTATPAIHPSYPNKKLIAVLGTLIGAVAACGMVFGRHMLRSRVLSPRNIREIMGGDTVVFSYDSLGKKPLNRAVDLKQNVQIASEQSITNQGAEFATNLSNPTHPTTLFFPRDKRLDRFLLARSLGIASQLNSRIAVVDFDEMIETKGLTSKEFNGHPCFELSGKIDLFKVSPITNSLEDASNAMEMVFALPNQFDQTFVVMPKLEDTGYLMTNLDDKNLVVLTSIKLCETPLTWLNSLAQILKKPENQEMKAVVICT